MGRRRGRTIGTLLLAAGAALLFALCPVRRSPWLAHDADARSQGPSFSRIISTGNDLSSRAPISGGASHEALLDLTSIDAAQRRPTGRPRRGRPAPQITRALSSSGVPAGSPLTLIVGLDQTGRRGQPSQLSL